MSSAVNMLEGRDAIQRSMEMLEKWTHMKLMELNKAKCKVLLLGQGYPRYKYRLKEELIGSRPMEKVWGVVVDQKHDASQQCAFAAQRPTASWAASKEGWPVGRWWGLFHSALPL